MALLSRMMRTAAITGRTDTIHAWCASRQGGRWAEQTVRGAFRTVGPHPDTAPPVDPAERLRELTELHRSGVITDAEFERFRDRLPV